MTNNVPALTDRWMRRSRFVWAVVLAIMLGACAPSHQRSDAGAERGFDASFADGGVELDASWPRDAHRPRDAAADAPALAQCRSDADCGDDGIFCNGVDQCRPGHPSADVRGCVHMAETCGPDRFCVEAL